MAPLPSTPFTLHGGCFCTAIRYTVSIPTLSERPLNPIKPTDHSIGPQNEITARFPEICLDHCNSCRRVAGSVLQLWLIIPQSWVQFHLLPKQPSTSNPPTIPNHPAEELERISPKTTAVISDVSDILSKTYITKFSSSKGVTRTFCERCGTNISFHNETFGKSEMATQAGKEGVKREPHMDLTVGSLDDEGVGMEGFRPREMDYEGDGIGWVKRWLEVGEGGLLE